MSNTKFQNTCFSLKSPRKMNPPNDSLINTQSYNEISLFTSHLPLFLFHNPNSKKEGKKKEVIIGVR